MLGIQELRYMSWLTKIASVTFSIEGSHKISQPKQVSDIAHMLRDILWKQGLKEIANYYRIQPDGYGDNDETGTVNIYLNENELSMLGRIKAIISQFITDELNTLGIQANLRGPEKSNSTGGPVLRLDITQNDTSSIQRIPDLNMHNTGAMAILQTLGIQPEYSGTINASILYDLVSKAEQSGAADHVGLANQPTMERSESGSVHYDGGADEAYLRERLSALKELAIFALENGFQSISWA